MDTDRLLLIVEDDEAFARTLKVHRNTVKRQGEKLQGAAQEDNPARTKQIF